MYMYYSASNLTLNDLYDDSVGRTLCRVNNAQHSL